MGSILTTIDEKVRFFYPKTRAIIMLVALTLAIIPLPPLLLQIVSFALILSIGLMHGATDHILYMNAKGLKTSQPIPLRFFSKYLLTLALMALVWWLSPGIALGLFLLTSAYHFGQTQWQYLALSEKSLLKKSIYCLWGSLILCLLVILNAAESNLLINSALDSTLDVSHFHWLIYTVAFLFSLSLVLSFKYISMVTLSFELIEILVILMVAIYGDLLLSFALFFGLWHSLRASQVQIDKLKEDQEFNWKSFFLGSLPFTLISLFGIALLLWVSVELNQRIEPAMLFLIAISVLTMPHMVIYEEFYQEHDSNS